MNLLGEDNSGCSAASDCSWKIDDDTTSDTYGNNTCQVADESSMTGVNKYCTCDSGTWKSNVSGAAGASRAMPLPSSLLLSSPSSHDIIHVF